MQLHTFIATIHPFGLCNHKTLALLSNGHWWILFYNKIEHETVWFPLPLWLQKSCGVHGNCRSSTSFSWSCDRISISVIGEAACVCSSMSHTFAHTRSHFPYLETSPQPHLPLWANNSEDNAAMFAFCRGPRAPASPQYDRSTRYVSTSKIIRWVKKI